MDFKDYQIKISYKNIGEEAFSQIINPLLSCSKLYRRSVGFFNSNALAFIDDGILELAKNGGTIELATSPELSDEDVEAIKNGYDAREILESRFLSEFENSLDSLSNEHTRILYMLIKERIMDIKIVTKNGGIYHDKLAVLTDHSNNVVAFVGSNNESAGGYNKNYEKIRVYRSWLEYDRVMDEIEEFESIWNDSNDFLKVYNFSDALKKEVIKRVETHMNSGIGGNKKKPFELREYQKEARDAWINNGYKGFFEMATGTGKTITALYSAAELIRNKSVFTVIVAPYKHLVTQWVETIKEHIKDADVITVFGEAKNPDVEIYADYIRSKKEYKPIIAVTTIKSFCLTKYQDLYSRIEYEKLLIVDEAHNFYNNLSPSLSLQYKYKLGLSATPVFGKDEEKTYNLLEWFGGKVYSLPIEKAIGKFLVNYYYHPIYVYATDEDEEKFKKATQMMLSCVDQSTGQIIDEENFNIAYRSRLRAISMASEKIEKIQEIYNQVDDTDHTIIYCSDGKLFKNGGKNNENAELKHLDYILQLINDSIITNSSNKSISLKASRFTASEDAKTRMNLINSFNEGRINYLVAIRCLDEGIDIPTIKSALILSSNDNYREFVQRRGRILRKHDIKTFASIYDVIVLPSQDNKQFAEIEFRRYYEYAKLSIEKDILINELKKRLAYYDLTLDDIQFKNDYLYGGDLDE